VLAEALRLLRCPACRQGLAEASGALRCPARHSYDIARQGYVALALGAHAGDGAEMVAARGRVLSAGLFDPLAEALAEECAAAGKGAVIELGAGTGWYLARVLERLPDRVGVALDVSKPALRRAARAHPRAVAVGADVWGALPVRDGVAGLALSVFAPRNADETARMLEPGGILVAVTPGPGHLAELVEALDLLGTEERKSERLAEAHAERFRLLRERELSWPLELDREAALDLAAMGPSAFHGDPRSRAGELPEHFATTASVRIVTFLH
jgi:23S rRNA (guanine745-N1)-methyltransferase